MTRATSLCAKLAASLPGCLLLLATPSALPADGAVGRATASNEGCLPGDRGYLQASLRGALQAQLDWRGADLGCQGGVRADQRGTRLSLGGPLPGSGRRLRIIIGVDVPPAQSAAGPTPANVTVIVEGENRIYATQGAGHCAVEAFSQEALPVGLRSAGTAPRMAQYRVAARGYCIDPLPALTHGVAGAADRLYIDRFDFAALATFDPEPIDDQPPAR